MNQFRKLNAKEILAIIEENYTISQFAYNEWSEAKDVELSQELQDKIKAYTDSREKLKNHPGYNDRNKRDSEYELLQENYNSNNYPFQDEEAEILSKLGLGEVVEVEQFGGEGMGDDWYSVKYFKGHDVYIKVSGSYTSYSGTDFYEGFGVEVRPQEKTITVYE